jgi:hypothetical protein
MALQVVLVTVHWVLVVVQWVLVWGGVLVWGRP